MEHPLKTARTQAKMSQNELAKEAGLAKSTISQIERRGRVGCFASFKALGRVLEVNWKTLMEN